METGFDKTISISRKRDTRSDGTTVPSDIKYNINSESKDYGKVVSGRDDLIGKTMYEVWESYYLNNVTIEEAVDNGDIPLVKYLISKGENLDPPIINDPIFEVPILIAFNNGDKDMIDFIINQEINLNKTYDHTIKPLSLAARNLDTDMFDYLIRLGAKIDIDVVMKMFGFKGGDVPFLSFFIENYNISNGLLCSGIQFGIRLGTMDMFKFSHHLAEQYHCEAEDAPHHINYYPGYHPLHYVSYSTVWNTNIEEKIDFLLEKGFDIDQCWNSMTPLMIAAERNMYNTVKYLLEKEADPNKVCGYKGNSLNAALDLSMGLWEYEPYIDDEDRYDLYFDFYQTDHARARRSYQE